MLLASIILRESIRSTDFEYTYEIPDELSSSIKVGQLVEVPFGKGKGIKDGIVSCIRDGENETGYKLKRISRIIDNEVVLREDQLKLVDYISGRYVCTKGDAITLMVPSLVVNHRDPLVRFVQLSDESKALELVGANKIRSINQISIINVLLQRKKVSAQELLLLTGSNNSHLRALRDKNLIIVTNEHQDEEDTSSCITREISSNTSHVLNDEQQNAVDRICQNREKAKVFLLNGITGSGKTEVFLRCAEEFIKRGHSVLYLVPEISLTPQTINWISGRFDVPVAVLHSRLSAKEKYKQWDMIRSGVARIVVAARSGVFAPINDLRLIIIDEEHDSSYKSDKHPRYNAKDIAIYRAKLNDATVILGSATPSIESYYAGVNGYYELLKLRRRANPLAVLPKVTIVDMREQLKIRGNAFLSIPLQDKMSKAISEDKQIVLFLNRRGYTRTLICKDCGEPTYCPSCSVGMTLHNNRFNKDKLLVCHYCGYTVPLSENKCTCGSKDFSHIGFGTQQLEEHVKRLFPGVGVLRMDQDTTSGIGSHDAILSQFRDKKASILIGTQMIAKGHDFPAVTVVGILDTDIITASPDYRGSERAFQLITQAAGRAGRDGYKGEVFIQTYKPDNPVIRYAACQNYEEFYKTQIEYRQALLLPPFKACGEIMISSEDEERLDQLSADLNKYLRDFLQYQKEECQFELYGPIAAPIYELRGSFRNVFSIKARNKSMLNGVFKQVMEDFDYSIYHISFDSDR